MRLKRLREKREWTQQELAEKVGVSRVTVARIEIGNRKPSLELLERLAKALKVKVGDLLK
jgi:transcriptional regulator with XRE-family HTH domain